MPEPLKPCPFCGSSKLKAWANTVVCMNCGGSGPDIGQCYGPECEAESIENWNRRSPSVNKGGE